MDDQQPPAHPDNLWEVTQQETARDRGNTLDPNHYILGGDLVSQMTEQETNIRQGGDHSMRRDWMTWKGEPGNKDLKQTLARIVTEALPAGERYLNKIGVLVLLDTQTVTDVTLEELAHALMMTRHEVDTYNDDHETAHYFMVGTVSTTR